MKRATVAQLRAAFSYDPATGVFQWKRHRSRTLVGKIAGCLHKPTGYWFLSLDDRKYKGHIAAWAIHYGQYPTCPLDHRDLDKANNRIKNLRLADKSKNGANRPPLRTNTSGFKGVFWSNAAKKWMAQIRYDEKSHYLGLFATREAAARAYDQAALARYGEFARTNQQMNKFGDAA